MDMGRSQHSSRLGNDEVLRWLGCESRHCVRRAHIRPHLFYLRLREAVIQRSRDPGFVVWEVSGVEQASLEPCGVNPVYRDCHYSG